MKVSVLFFGHFRDIHPDGLEMDLPDRSTVADLASTLGSQDPRLEPIVRICRAAVSEEYVPTNTVLKAGDTVAFIPPMSGGVVEG